MLFAKLPDLRHDRVRLRPLEPADIGSWFKYLALPQVFEHTSWDVQDVQELAHYAWQPQTFTASSMLRFAIALRSSDRLVGTAGFHTVSPLNGSAEIAYDLAPDCWGQGIASAVCAALVRCGHGDAALTRVQATVLETNSRSVAVLERCGFRHEGMLQAYRKVRGRHGNFHMYAHVRLPGAQ
jgi:ribosomal-protein-alanine N-acetyltransferase